MQARIATIRARIRYDERTGSDEIGCIQLVLPVFFNSESWVPQPRDWQPRTQTPVKYDLATAVRVGESGRPACRGRSMLERSQQHPTF